MEIIGEQKQKLITESGDRLEVTTQRSVYEILSERGYLNLDLSYGDRNITITHENLTKNFEPITNFVSLTYNKENLSFGSLYNWWYNKDTDTYIRISTYLEDIWWPHNDDVVDEINDFSEMYRVTQIFYTAAKILSVKSILNKLCTFKEDTSNKIQLILQAPNGGFTFQSFNLKTPHVDIDTMYNDDFVPVYEHIVDKLNTGDKGIVLLHGIPGVGKSYLLRSLTRVVDKTFVFVPVNMVASLADPGFMGALIDNKGSILVIEDCETYLRDRDTEENPVVSSILQITDGALADILGIQVICTFNQDTAKIDKALKREGRLIAEYEFQKLSADKVEALTDGRLTEPATLAEIFDTMTYRAEKKQTKKIGYGNNL